MRLSPLAPLFNRDLEPITLDLHRPSISFGHPFQRKSIMQPIDGAIPTTAGDNLYRISTMACASVKLMNKGLAISQWFALSSISYIPTILVDELLIGSNCRQMLASSTYVKACVGGAPKSAAPQLRTDIIAPNDETSMTGHPNDFQLSNLSGLGPVCRQFQ